MGAVNDVITIERFFMYQRFRKSDGIKMLLIFGAILLSGYTIHIWTELGKYPDKIWLHRCNSIEKLYEKQDCYPNIEVDVVFRKNGSFDITHDADTSFQLGLESYFTYIQGKNRKIWLDVKNLTDENTFEMLDALNKLVKHFNISKNQLILESNCGVALKVFTENGYYTSLYVTYDKPSRIGQEKLKACIRELKTCVDMHIVRALSFPGWWYDEIKASLDSPIDLLVWKHRTTQFELLFFPEGRELLNDSRVKVVLVKDKGRYHR